MAERPYRVRIAEVSGAPSRVVALLPRSRSIAGNGPRYLWEIGEVGTGAPIEIESPLLGAQLCIVRGSNHVLLLGSAHDGMPEVSVFYGMSRAKIEDLVANDELPIFDDRRWDIIPSDMLVRGEETHVYLRFESKPLRIGTSVVQPFSRY